MLSETEVGNIFEQVKALKGWTAYVTVRLEGPENKFVVGISGGVHKPFEFAIPVGSTADEIRKVAEKVFSVQP